MRRRNWFGTSLSIEYKLCLEYTENIPDDLSFVLDCKELLTALMSCFQSHFSKEELVGHRLCSEVMKPTIEMRLCLLLTRTSWMTINWWFQVWTRIYRKSTFNWWRRIWETWGRWTRIWSNFSYSYRKSKMHNSIRRRFSVGKEDKLGAQ